MSEYYSDIDETDEISDTEDYDDEIREILAEDDLFDTIQNFKFDIEDRTPEFHFLTWIPTQVLIDVIDNYTFKPFRNEPLPPENITNIMGQFVELVLGKNQEYIVDSMDLASLYYQLLRLK